MCASHVCGCIPAVLMQMSHEAGLPQPLVELIAARFRALGEPARIRLLERLRLGEACVQELVAATGWSQQNVSRHLAVLLHSGIVARRRAHGRSYYWIADPGVVALCDQVCSSVERQASELSRLLAQAEPAGLIGRS
jgi:DNA-binding transcriptional ArsR family regulator